MPASSSPYTTANVAGKLVELTYAGQVPTTYRALEEALGGNPSDRRHARLSMELGKVQVLCAASALPCLPVLASRELGIRPGQGFFTAYRDAYGIEAQTEAGKDRVVVLERAAVTATPTSFWTKLLEAAQAGAEA